MSHNTTCLNCNELVTKKFCPNCGQKTDTHRITFKHFITHDLLHGVWHIEKGILFTLKEALLRPGKAALDYISGKRIKYYNVFYLSLLAIGFNVLLLHFYDVLKPNEKILINKVEKAPNINKFLTDNVKFILFSIVPILGICSNLIFKRLKLNIAEHFIIGGMCLLGMIELTIVFSFLNFLNEHFSYTFFSVIQIISLFTIVLFPVWCYFDAIKGKYTNLGTIWRLTAFFILVIFLLLLFLLIIIYKVTQGTGSFNISL
jgi:hypothetical protein